MNDTIILSKEQEDFIEKHIKQTKQDIWREQLIKLRGIQVKDGLSVKEIDKCMDNWNLEEIKDSGEQTRGFKCDCKRSIRYQYIIKHKSLEVTHKLGVECVKKYTNIDGKYFRKVLVHHEKINKMVDEIKSKISTNEIKKQVFLLNNKDLPDVIRQQLLLGIPLAEKQLKKIFKSNDKSSKSSKTVYNMLSNLKEEEIELINDNNSDDSKTLIIKLKNGNIISDLNSIDEINPEDIAIREDRYVSRMNTLRSKNILRTKNTFNSEEKKESKDVKLIVKARDLLNKEQIDFWNVRMSFDQRNEIAKYIMEGSNIVDPEVIKDMVIDEKLRTQINLGLPLTEKQKKILGI